MIVTEEEARTKACCGQATTCIVIIAPKPTGEPEVINDGPPHHVPICCASDCMAWVWHSAKRVGCCGEERIGFCGLAGKP